MNLGMQANKEVAEQKDIDMMKQKIKELPLKERVRAVALFHLFQQKVELDKVMDKEVTVPFLYQTVESKYLAIEAPILVKQQEIICGERAPTPAELEKVENVLSDKEKESKESLISEVKAEKIENYWVKVFSNCEVLQEEMNKKDEPVINFLQKIAFSKDGEKQTFVFTFAENQYFSNTTLTKVFYMKEEDHPDRSEGTEINWKGEDLTKKTIKKKQKNKKTGQTRVVEKTVPEQSFFNFFNSVNIEESNMENLDDEEAEEMENNMHNDLEIASLLEDEAVPFSIEYFLGIVKNEEEGEEGDDDSDDDDDDSEDEKPVKGKKKNSSDKKDQDPKQKEECKQQ